MADPLTCRQCGGDVLVMEDERGVFESHEMGADHSPDVERLGTVTDAAERLGVDGAEVWEQVAASVLIAEKIHGKPNEPWVIYRA